MDEASGSQSFWLVKPYKKSSFWLEFLVTLQVLAVH